MTNTGRREDLERDSRASGQSRRGQLRHIAFIMDGNGRWARQRGLRRVAGHEHGATSLRNVTQRCRELGIRELTFFALSAENYLRRPSSEIRFLLNLLRRYLVEERGQLEENDIRLSVIGEIDSFPGNVREEIEKTIELTSTHRSMLVRLALNYGARQEILGAVRAVARDVAEGRLEPERIGSIDEGAFRRYFHDPDMPDPDLVIRTAGEYRLSNFLLWQSSYSELWVTDCLWPDFGVPELERALEAYHARERKYGALSSRGVSRS